MKKIGAVFILMTMCMLVEAAGCSCGSAGCGCPSSDSKKALAVNARRGGGDHLSNKTSSGYGQATNDMLTKKKKPKTSIEDSIKKQFEKVSVATDPVCSESKCSCCACNSSEKLSKESECDSSQLAEKEEKKEVSSEVKA